MSATRNQPPNPPNPYEVLGCDKAATNKEITKAYRNLALQRHPDKDRDNPSADENFKMLHAAYEILKDPVKRKIFDAGGSVDAFMSSFANTDDFQTSYNSYQHWSYEEEQAAEEAYIKTRDMKLNYFYSTINGHRGRVAKTLVITAIILTTLLAIPLAIPITMGLAIYFMSSDLMRSTDRVFTSLRSTFNLKAFGQLMASSAKLICGVLLITIFSPIIAIVALVGLVLEFRKARDISVKFLYQYAVVYCDAAIEKKLKNTRPPAANTHNASYRRFSESMPFQANDSGDESAANESKVDNDFIVNLSDTSLEETLENNYKREIPCNQIPSPFN